jgi:hypothetical protein
MSVVEKNKFSDRNFYFIYLDMGKIKHKCFVNNKIGDKK